MKHQAFTELGKQMNMKLSKWDSATIWAGAKVRSVHFADYFVLHS